MEKQHMFLWHILPVSWKRIFCILRQRHPKKLKRKIVKLGRFRLIMIYSRIGSNNSKEKNRESNSLSILKFLCIRSLLLKWKPSIKAKLGKCKTSSKRKWGLCLMRTKKRLRLFKPNKKDMNSKSIILEFKTRIWLPNLIKPKSWSVSST